ncbi:MAG: tetratricopeptide repeat protein [Myxococcota bacterium]
MVSLGTSLAELSSAIEQEPSDPNNWYRLAEALIERGQTDDAHQALRQVAALTIEDAAWLTKTARQLARIGAIHDAQSVIHRAVRQRPEMFEARLAFGEILLMAGDTNAGIVALRVAASLSPKAQQPYLLMAQGLSTAGRAQEALQTVERALKLGAAPEDVHQLRCRLLLALERFDEYEKTLQDGLKSAPDDVELTISLGQQYARTDRKEEARKLLLPAVDQVSEQDGQKMLRLGRALLQAGALETAIQCLQTAIQCLQTAVDRQSKVADAHLALGCAYHAADRLEDAIAAYEAAAQLAPDHADTFHAWSKTLQKAGRLQASADKLAHAIAHTNDEAVLRRRRARLAKLRGELQAPIEENSTEDLTHDLSEFPLTDFIELLVTQKATGILTVTAPAGTAGIGLHGGFVAYSFCPGVPSLSELALELGYLSSKTLNSDSEKPPKFEDDAEVVAFLCAETTDGLVSAQDLVIRQASATLSILLKWQEGQAAFRRREDAAKQTEVRIDTRWLMIEAQRQDGGALTRNL